MKWVMNDILLHLYTLRDFERLFRMETRESPSEGQLLKFRDWLYGQYQKVSNLRLPHEVHIWILCKIHEYSRLDFV
ncbi:MAG: hypothetical protein A3A65_02435 [Candidatus Chisholmbacteria bacterium RIFCSPLOWO2_01_FULL_49_14]|nr:MAG: hypothetical protein A3A65_02435 [Candidatus Chisholmbacteria bacterium RIFCSPLOWO2_01_FULL_49_14]